MKKKITGSLLALVLVVSLVACGKNSAVSNDVNKDESNKKPRVLRFATGSTSGKSGELGGIVQSKGYAKEELEKIGYEIEYVNFPAAGPAINEAFVSEEVDFAEYGDLPPVVLKSKGVGVSIIAVTNSNVNISLLVQEDSGINSIKDIKGKKIIVGKGTIYHQFFQNMIDANNVDEKDVEIINTVAEAPSTYLSKNADGYVLNDITSKLVLRNGTGNIIFSSKDNPDFASQTVIAARDKYLEENPKVGVALLKAYIRAQEYARSNPDEAYKIFSEVGIDEELIKSAYDYDGGQFKFLSIEITDNNINRLNRLSDFLRKNNLTTKEVKGEEIVNRSYYETAKKELNK